MDRRTFLRRASILAAGAVAADQLDLLERLTHKKVWAGHTFKREKSPYDLVSYALGFTVTKEMIEQDALYLSGKGLHRWVESISQKLDRDITINDSLLLPRGFRDKQFCTASDRPADRQYGDDYLHDVPQEVRPLHEAASSQSRVRQITGPSLRERMARRPGGTL